MSYVAVAIGVTQGASALIQGSTDRAMAGVTAEALNYQGDQEKRAAYQQAMLIRRAARYQTGAADADYAASGVEVGTGSAAETDRRIAIDSEHDVYQTILAGEKRANALKVQATGVRAQGDLAQSNAVGKAASSVLGSYYQGMTNSGWRTAGPGYSGTQAPAPVVDRSVYPKG